MEWRPIPGFEQKYEASRDGRVRRIGGDELATPVDRDGYPRANLSIRRGKTKNAMVHWCVTRAFLGDPPDGCQVHHLNEDKTDNRLSNLKYVPTSGHMANHKYGNKNNARMTRKQAQWAYDSVTAGRRTLQQCADKIGVTKQAIWCIAHGKTWPDLDRK
jgi:hypothetical protein